MLPVASAAPSSILPFGYAPFWTLVWCCGLLVSCLLLATRRTGPLEALAWGLMSVPVWVSVWGFVNSIPVLVATDDVLRPATPAQLSRMFYRSVLVDLGYLGAGFLLWLHVRTGGVARLGVRGVAAALRDATRPLAQPREGRSLAAGYALFPLLLIGTALANWFLTRNVPGLVNGDESRFWDHLDPYRSVSISLAAGFTEELVYRAFLLVVLFHALRRAAPAWPAGAHAALAILGQATLFGLAHAGYGTWIHVLLPFLFGVVAGLVAWRWGLWAAIALHVQVDLYVFLNLLPDARFPWATPLLIALFALNVAVLVAWTAAGLLERWRRRRDGDDEVPSPPGPPGPWPAPVARGPSDK